MCISMCMRICICCRLGNRTCVLAVTFGVGSCISGFRGAEPRVHVEVVERMGRVYLKMEDGFEELLYLYIYIYTHIYIYIYYIHT